MDNEEWEKFVVKMVAQKDHKRAIIWGKKAGLNAAITDIKRTALIKNIEKMKEKITNARERPNTK